MEDSTVPPSSTINPLISRLDRLDFIMKYLERRTKSETNTINDGRVYDNDNSNEGLVMEKAKKNCIPIPIPMELALKDVESKGPLVDRVAALETRLFQVKRAVQISLEMDEESNGGSGSSSQSSGDTLSLRSRGDFTSSLPTFNSTKPSQIHVMATTHEIEEECDDEEVEVNPSPPKHKTEKKKKEKRDEEKSLKSGKKRSPSWLSSRLLGC